MNKFGRFYKFLLCIGAALIIAGCDNFMDGGSLKDDIESKVNYISAPSVKAVVQKADIDDNGTIFPAGNVSGAKVGLDNFEISYTASSSYYFLYWQAVDSDNNVLDSSVVKFKDSTQAKTTATVYTTSDVKILAVTSPVPKAVVSFKKNFDAAGTVTTGEVNSFSMDEEFSFNFESADGYQFIKWQASNDCVEILNPYSSTSKAVAKKDGGVTVTAVCVERPHVGAGNTNPTATDSVCKDTNVIINFDKPLANPEEELSEIGLYLNGVKLYYGEEEAFGNPYYYKSEDETEYSRIVIPAHSKYALDVPAGKTSVIRVMMPDSLYCIDEESGNKIYLCPEGNTYSWTYKINENTNDKAKISVKSDSKTGTLTGLSGDYNIGRTVEYSFKTASSAQFINWKITSVPPEAVNVTITSDSNVEKVSIYVIDRCDVDIETVAVIRPAVIAKETLPAVTKTGVTFDTEARVMFDTSDKYKINEESLLKDAGVNYGTIDIGDYFNKTFADNELVFSLKEDPASLIELRNLLYSSETTGIRQITVKVPASCVYYEYEAEQIYMLNDYVYTYNVNSSTSTKTKIKFESTEAGTFKVDGDTIREGGARNEYSLGEIVDLRLTPDSKYQFIKWNIEDENIAEIEDETSLTTRLHVKDYGTISVNAVTAARPKVSSNTDSTDKTYAKDTSLYINFDRALAKDNDLTKIVIYAGTAQLSYGEKEAFGEPVFGKDEEGNTVYSQVIIPANTFSAIEVAAGKTVTVRVELPSELYYTDEATGEKIYLCSEGSTYSWTYKINEKTASEVTFELASDSLAGTMTGKAGNYNLGTEVTYTYKPNSAYKFIGWTVIQQPAGIVEVVKTSAEGLETISFTTKSAGTVKVEAVTAEKLTVTSLTPASKLEGVAKNSDIEITFNKAIANTNGQDLEKIEVLLDGVDVKNCYKNPVISEDKKTVTFKADNKNLLPVEKGTKIVTVIVPSDFYYNVSEAVKVNLEEYSKSFVVNATTKEKAVININTTVGTLSPSGLYEYYIDNTFEVLYKPATGYRFDGWIIEKGSSSAEFIKIENSDEYYVRFYEDDSKSVYRDCLKISMTENANQYKAVFTVLEEISGCSLRPSFSLVPEVTGFQPYYTFAGTDYDSNIVIEFNKSMNPANFEGFYSEKDESTKNYAVSITSKTGIDLTSFFYPPVGSENNKKWTIRPDVTKLKTLLETDSIYDIFVTVRSVAQDSSEDALSLEYDYEKSYRINTGHEEAAPAFEDFTFASSRENLVSQKYCSDKDFDDWRDEATAEYKYGDFSKNHVNNALSFKFKVSELGTGLEKLVITETRVRSVTAETVSEKTEDTVIDLSSKGNVTNLDFDYTFKSENDGVIEIKFTCFDKVGNSSVKKVYAIRDTVYSLIDLRIGNGWPNGENNPHYPLSLMSIKDHSVTDDVEKNKERVSNILIYANGNEYTDFYDYFYGDYRSELDELETSIEYWNVNGEKFNVQPLLNQTKTYWVATLKKELLDFDRNIYLKATVKDKVGNEIVQTRVIPSCTDINIYEEDSSFKIFCQFDERIDNRITLKRTYYKKDNGYDSTEKYKKDTDYYLEYDITSFGQLRGLVKHFVINDQTISTIPEIKIPDYTVSTVQGETSSGTFIATVTLDEIDEDATYYYSYNYINPSSNNGKPEVNVNKFIMADINYKNKSFTFTVPYDASVASGEQKKLYMKLKVEKKGYSEISSASSWEVEGDCLPPVVSASYSNLSSSVTRSNNSITVSIHEDTGLKIYEDGYGLLEYALTPISDTITDITQIEDLTEAEWNSKTRYTVKINPKGIDKYNYYHVDIPYATIQPDITYRIDAKVEDSLGNTKITKTVVMSNSSKSDYSGLTCERKLVKIKKDEVEVEVPRLYIGNSKGKNLPYAFGWVFNGSEMIELFRNYNPGGANPYNFLSSGEYIDETFYCVCANQDWNTGIATDPYYYLFSENREANLKDLIEGVKGATVMCDNKTLLFTAYSKYDLGTDFQKWNRCASKTDFAQLDKMTTYIPGADSVPKGYYYCIIAIFADGDYAMTTPKIK